MRRVMLGLFAMIMLAGPSGCTWTETYRDYPPGVETRDHQHDDADHIAE